MKKVLYALPALAVFGVLAGGPLPGRDHDHAYLVVNGDAYSDFPVTSLPVAAAEARKEGSRTVLKSDRFFGVRVGKGGPEIKLETLNGDILIKKNA